MKRLEVELASELQLARIACADNLSGAGCIGTAERVSSLRRIQVDVDIAPLRVIEDVVGLKPELIASVLGEVKVLEERHVEVRDSGAVNCIAAEVAEAPRCRRSKGSRVVPHGILALGLVVVVRGQNLSANIVRPYVAESTVA